MAFCKAKTTFDIHRDLCQKHIESHSEYDLIGPFDKYRDVNYKIYKQKCAEFKAKGREAKDLNIKALTNYKTKLGDPYIFPEDTFLMKYEESDSQNAESTSFVRASIISDDSTIYSSQSSTNTLRESGVALRKRHERHYQHNNQLTEQKCNFDPWFGRYLILCKFINAGRRVILTYRMLKRLKVLKKLTPEMISYYEKNRIDVEHLIYPEIFKKYTSSSD